MNFPEVPFDENLFASNTMLKSYWERSTNERAGAVIPDWPSEESSDSKELRVESMDLWKRNEEPALEEPIVLAQTAEKSRLVKDERGALVKPKMSDTLIAVSFIGLAVLLILVFFIYAMYQTPKQGSARRV